VQNSKGVGSEHQNKGWKFDQVSKGVSGIHKKGRISQGTGPPKKGRVLAVGEEVVPGKSRTKGKKKNWGVGIERNYQAVPRRGQRKIRKHTAERELKNNNKTIQRHFGV